jgi:hypothetical protein
MQSRKVFALASIVLSLIVTSSVNADVILPPENSGQSIQQKAVLKAGEMPNEEWSTTIKGHIAYAKSIGKMDEVKKLELLLQGKVDASLNGSNSPSPLAATYKYSDTFFPTPSGLQGCRWTTSTTHYAWGTNYHTVNSATAANYPCYITSIRMDWYGSNYGTPMYSGNETQNGTRGFTKDGYAGLLGFYGLTYALYNYGNSYYYEVNVYVN